MILMLTFFIHQNKFIYPTFSLELFPWTGKKKKRLMSLQRAKRVVSDSPGLVDFAIGRVNSVVNLPHGQVMFFEQFE